MSQVADQRRQIGFARKRPRITMPAGAQALRETRSALVELWAHAEDVLEGMER